MKFENKHTGETIHVPHPSGGWSEILLNGQRLHRVRFCDRTMTATIEGGRTYDVPKQFVAYLLSLIQPKEAGRDA